MSIETLPESLDPEPSKRNAGIAGHALERNADEAAIDAIKNPRFIASFLSFVIDFVPVLGPSQKYLQARKEFKVEALKDVARERFIIAVMEMGLDVVTMGGSATIPDEVLTLLNRLNLLVKARSKGEKVHGFNRVLSVIDIPGRVAQKLLKNSYVKKAVDAALSV